MDDARQLLLFYFSTPLYALLIGAEIILSFLHDKRYYRISDTLTNLYLSSLNLLLELAFRVVALFILDFFFSFHFIELTHPVVYWGCLLLLQDAVFYLEHRIDHYCRFFWAVHVTHHSSDYFNLTTGFRSSVFQPLYRFVYFIPLALLGFRSIDILLMFSITQIYGILIHTRYIGKLGPLEWILATPSHHRVHHASNTLFLDKNMGMVLIIWDRMFGTFASESDLKAEEIRFGLTKKSEHPNHPMHVVFHEWRDIVSDLRRKDIDWKTKLKYVFMPPGWSHDGSRFTSVQLRKMLVNQNSKSRETDTQEQKKTR